MSVSVMVQQKQRCDIRKIPHLAHDADWAQLKAIVLKATLLLSFDDPGNKRDKAY